LSNEVFASLDDDLRSFLQHPEPATTLQPLQEQVRALEEIAVVGRFTAELCEAMHEFWLMRARSATPRTYVRAPVEPLGRDQ
jgi:hypothetical protein